MKLSRVLVYLTTSLGILSSATMIYKAGRKQDPDHFVVLKANDQVAPVKDIDEGLEELKDFNNLGKLGVRVTDASLRKLREKKLLHALGRARGVGGSRAASDSEVVELDLNNTQVTDSGLKELNQFTSLASLDLRDTKVTGVGLRELNQSKLSKLVLGGRQFPEAGLKELSQLAYLTDLELDNIQMSEAGIGELKALRQLIRLSIHDSLMTDDRLKAVGELESLTELNLCRASVTDVGARELKNLKHLAVLDISGTDITDAGLIELAGLKNIMALKLGRVPHQTFMPTPGLDIMTLGSSGKQLVVQHDGYSTFMNNATTSNFKDDKITNAGLKALKELKSLTSLSLCSGRVTNDGLKELKELKNLTRLELHPWATPEAIKELQAALPKCKISTH
jgi:Leucine-rich repeat (LRR) protein